MWLTGLLLLALFVGCYTDINTRRIPNYLTFGLMITGLAYNSLAGPGWFFSLSGIGVGFVLFLLPYLFTGMGAGDVKLMMGVGAILGWQQAIYIGVLSSIFAALYAVIKLQRQGKFKELLLSTIGQAHYILAKTQLNDYSREIFGGSTIPYAVPVTLSTMMVLLWR